MPFERKQSLKYWHPGAAHGETELCINGRILAIGAHFKEPNDALANQLLGEQLEDGGWNCEAPKSRGSSFHITICVLEGLLEYEQQGANRRPSPRPARGPKTICLSAACSARFDRRSHSQTLAPLLVPDVLALRRLARTRLSAECRNQTRQPRP
jgi:hypothetical protein